MFSSPGGSRTSDPRVHIANWMGLGVLVDASTPNPIQRNRSSQVVIGSLLALNFEAKHVISHEGKPYPFAPTGLTRWGRFRFLQEILA